MCLCFDKLLRGSGGYFRRFSAQGSITVMYDDEVLWRASSIPHTEAQRRNAIRLENSETYHNIENTREVKRFKLHFNFYAFSKENRR